MPDNLRLYDKFRKVPEEAKKPIEAGRLKGMTDINPMYRIKALTEQFGPCGIGWWYVIKDKHIERMDDGQVAAFVDIDLYYELEGKQSYAIPGTGGSMLVAQERNGLHVSDECYKMALTDAISVACKSLGIGADVYWQKDRTKYSDVHDEPVKQAEKKAVEQKKTDTATHSKRGLIEAYCTKHKLTMAEMQASYTAHTERPLADVSFMELQTILTEMEKQ
jgi:hypothetical protein